MQVDPDAHAEGGFVALLSSSYLAAASELWAAHGVKAAAPLPWDRHITTTRGGAAMAYRMQDGE
jgi:hypothetical protein